MSTAFTAQASKDFQADQKLREKSRGSLGKIRREAAGGVRRLEKAHTGARAALGQRSAQALAATAGQVGGAPAGGGQAATLRQAAMSRGTAEGQQNLQFASALGDARSKAADKVFEADAAESALGNLTGERQAKMGLIEQNLQNLMDQHLSGTLGFGDDLGSFQTAAQALLMAEGDPQVREQAMKRIREISAANDSANVLNVLLYPLTGDEGAKTGL